MERYNIYSMTLIAAVGFPEEIIILSDSRMSYKNDVKLPSDNLKKIYGLSPYSVITYTTDDVSFTHKLIEKITIEAIKSQKDKTEIILRKIVSYAKTTYDNLSRNNTPNIVLIYAGMVNKPYVISKNIFVKMMKKYGHNHFMPKKLKVNLEGQSKTIIIAPRTPLLIKQHLPSGKFISLLGWNMTTDGSGSDFIKELDKYYTKVFFVPGALNKGIILNDLCESFIKTSKVKSIGGTVQIFSVTESGVTPIMYQEGNIRKKYIDSDGNWIEENIKTGQINKIVQNP